MNNEFKVEVKRVANGKKVKVVVYCNGVEIGSRSSARPYRSVMITRRNRSWELQRAKQSLIWNKEQAAEYAAVAIRQDPHYSKSVINYGKQSVEASIQDGSYAKWSKDNEAAAEKAAHEIERLSSPEHLPEFDIPVAQSFHQGKVPPCPEHRVLVTILEIPQV